MSQDKTFPPITDLLPHRGTMLLLDAVTNYGPETLEAYHRVSPGHWYSGAEGEMPAWIGIELMAQAIAAHVGMQARSRNEQPKAGALLGTKAYRCTVPSFPAGDELAVSIRVVYRDEVGLGAYNASILRGDQELATATLKVYEPEDFLAFIQGSVS